MRTAPVALAHLDDRGRLAQRRAQSPSSRTAILSPVTRASCGAKRFAWPSWKAGSPSPKDSICSRRAAYAWQGAARRRARRHPQPKRADPGERFRPNGFTVTARYRPRLRRSSLPTYPCGCPVATSNSLCTARSASATTPTRSPRSPAACSGPLGRGAPCRGVAPDAQRVPGLDGIELVSLAALTATGGQPDHKGWPSVGVVPYSEWASPDPVPHPYDDGVLLGTHASRGHRSTRSSRCAVSGATGVLRRGGRGDPLTAHGQ